MAMNQLVENISFLLLKKYYAYIFTFIFVMINISYKLLQDV